MRQLNNLTVCGYSVSNDDGALTQNDLQCAEKVFSWICWEQNVFGWRLKVAILDAG